MEMTYSVWNEELGNYCLASGKTEESFIYPLQPLKLSEVDKSNLSECLQSIYYKRTGKIAEEIGISYEMDREIAKVMKCWD